MPLLHTVLSLQVWYKFLSTLAIFEDIIWWRERDIGQKDLSRRGIDTVVSVSAQSKTGSQIKEKESTIQQYVNNLYAREITRNCWSTSTVTSLGMQTWLRDPKAHSLNGCNAGGRLACIRIAEHLSAVLLLSSSQLVVSFLPFLWVREVALSIALGSAEAHDSTLPPRLLVNPCLHLQTKFDVWKHCVVNGVGLSLWHVTT